MDECAGVERDTVKETPVDEAFNRLFSVLTGLEDKMSPLRDKLNPVLSIMPTEGGKTCDEASDIPLVRRIEEATDRVIHCSQCIQTTINEISL